MDEPEKVESYRALYRVRPLIYHVGDIRLWMPIRQDAVVLWLVYLFLFFILCYVVPVLAWVLPVDRMITMSVGPIAAAYYTVKLDPAGKSVPRYLLDVLQFLIRPKWVVRWQSARYPGGSGPVRFAGSCRTYGKVVLPNGLEEWHGATGAVQGKVTGLQRLVSLTPLSMRWHGRIGKLRIEPIKRPVLKGMTPPMELQNKMRTRLFWRWLGPVELNRKVVSSEKETWTAGKPIVDGEGRELP